MHTGALSVDIDASGMFRGSLKGLAIAISQQRDFLVFHDFDDVLVFSRAGYG